MDIRSLGRADRSALWFSVAVVSLGAVVTVASAIARIVEIASGAEVPVTAELSGQTAPLTLGPDGSEVDAVVETATVMLHDPSGGVLAALYAQPVWWALTVTTGLVLAGALLVLLARGRAFAGRASRFVYVGALVLAVGWFGNVVLDAVVTGAAIDSISDGTSASWALEIDLVPFLGILFLGALGGAFQVGERLHKETEGLV